MMQNYRNSAVTKSATRGLVLAVYTPDGDALLVLAN